MSLYFSSVAEYVRVSSKILLRTKVPLEVSILGLLMLGAIGCGSSVMTVYMLVFILCSLLMVAFLVLVERNILSLAQIRKSPNTVGLWGIVQTAMDSIKLLMKKMMHVSSIRELFFYLSPVVSLVISFIGWLFIPMPYMMYCSMSSVLWTLFVSSLLVYPIMWASWSSGGVYSTMSGVRAVAQMVSYEVVMGFYILSLMFSFSWMTWESFIYFQMTVGNWMVMSTMVGVWVWIMLAELNRTPFDLVEGESELVSSFNVEYSGYGFTLLFLSEYLSIWLMSFITVLMISGTMWWVELGVLSVVVVILVVYVRCLLPRYKYIDLISLTWVIYVPAVVGMMVFMTHMNSYFL